MKQWEVGVQVEKPFGAVIDRRWLGRVISKTLEMEGVIGPAGVGALITGDERVQELNKAYRGMDTTTDVLAFSMREGDGMSSSPPDGMTRLGDVVISCPQAERQAREQGHSLEKEVAFLAVHGVLHLLGYDHEKPDDETAMKARQRAVLDALGLAS